MQDSVKRKLLTRLPYLSRGARRLTFWVRSGSRTLIRSPSSSNSLAGALPLSSFVPWASTDHWLSSLLEAAWSFISASSSSLTSSFSTGGTFYADWLRTCCKGWGPVGGFTTSVLQWWGVRRVNGSLHWVISSKLKWVSIWIRERAFSKNTINIPAGIWKLENLFDSMLASLPKEKAEC